MPGPRAGIARACGIEPPQAAKFVTQEGFPLPAGQDVEYEEVTAEMTLLVSKDDLDGGDEGPFKAAFEAEGLHLDDVDGDPTITDARGNVVGPETDLNDPSVSFPLTAKCLVRRRKKPSTVAEAFRLGSCC